jgi:ATP-binding cassette subfamily F protein uup
MLTEFEGSAIVVTHDRWFLNRVATSILAFEGDGRVVRYAGNYDGYRAQKAGAEAAAESAASAAKAQAQAQATKAPPPGPRAEGKPKALTFAERNELDGIVERIDAADRRVGELEVKLADPALYVSRGAEVAGLRADLDRAREDSARLVARWEELEMKREASTKG